MKSVIISPKRRKRAFIAHLKQLVIPKIEDRSGLVNEAI